MSFMRSIKRRLAWLTVVLVTALTLAAPSLADAIVVKRGRSVLVGPAFTPGNTVTARVTVTNVGKGPVLVRVRYLRATDFTELAVSAELPVLSRSSEVFDQALGVEIPSEFPVLVVVQVMAASHTDLRATLQVQDSSENTLIFDDGFESGDTTAF